MNRPRYVGSALAGALLAPRAFAQNPVRIHRIGILADQDEPTLHHPFHAALNELGYVEGKNIAIVARYGAKGQIERLRKMVGELVDTKVDIIAVFGGDVAIRAARDATATIPIVMVFGRDPVGVGFAASLARPGGNITGVTIDVSPQENSKRMQLLKEAVPSMKTLVRGVTSATAIRMSWPSRPARARWASSLRKSSCALGPQTSPPLSTPCEAPVRTS